MGHTRLGSPPITRKWKAIASLLAGGEGEGLGSRKILADDVETVFLQTLGAVEVGLDKAIGDMGLQYTFYLLTQLVLSARESDWQAHLADVGIHLSEGATLFDLTSEVQNAIDDYLAVHGRPSDVSEMAQQAAGEAIATLAGPEAVTLFGSGRDELRAAIRELSSKKGFSDLGQKFFGRFLACFLNFHLSRITAAQLGEERLQQVGDLSRFNEVLRSHCEQSARIVRDFCGEWYSKTEFHEGINLDNTSRFMAVALKKIQAELKRQKAES